jgi:acyl dehydratase
MRSFDLITDLNTSAIAQIQALVGLPIRVEQWNHEATWDTMRHYSYGLGDDNPLFSDPVYAGDTPYKTIVAHPTFLLTAFDGAIGAGLPGVQPIYAGASWVFHRRVMRGSSVVATARFGQVRRTSGSVAKDFVIQDSDCEYHDGDGNLLATMVASTFRVPRRSAATGLNYAPRSETIYSDEELAEIQASAIGEYRRGSGDLSEVRVGDELPAVVKGPLGRIDMTAYYAGLPGSPGYKACEIAWKYRDFALNNPGQLPNNYDPSYYSERILPSIGHQDSAAAQELGMPNAYNNGPQRVGWFASCITNWMGDGAFLTSLSVRLNRPEIFGDVIRIRGKVVAQQAARLPTFNVELIAVNQNGDTTATGIAVVTDDNYGRR